MSPPALFTFPLLPQQLGHGLTLYQTAGGTSQPASPSSGSSLIYGKTRVHSFCPHMPPLLLAAHLELVPSFATFFLDGWLQTCHPIQPVSGRPLDLPVSGSARPLSQWYPFYRRVQRSQVQQSQHPSKGPSCCASHPASRAVPPRRKLTW